MEQLKAIIKLAAGKIPGTRMKSELPKNRGTPYRRTMSRRLCDRRG